MAPRRRAGTARSRAPRPAARGSDASPPARDRRGRSAAARLRAASRRQPRARWVRSRRAAEHRSLRIRDVERCRAQVLGGEDRALPALQGPVGWKEPRVGGVSGSAPYPPRPGWRPPPRIGWQRLCTVSVGGGLSWQRAVGRELRGAQRLSSSRKPRAPSDPEEPKPPASASLSGATSSRSDRRVNGSAGVSGASCDGASSAAAGVDRGSVQDRFRARRCVLGREGVLRWRRLGAASKGGKASAAAGSTASSDGGPRRRPRSVRTARRPRGTELARLERWGPGGGLGRLERREGLEAPSSLASSDGAPRRRPRSARTARRPRGTEPPPRAMGASAAVSVGSNGGSGVARGRVSVGSNGRRARPKSRSARTAGGPRRKSPVASNGVRVSTGAAASTCSGAARNGGGRAARPGADRRESNRGMGRVAMPFRLAETRGEVATGAGSGRALESTGGADASSSAAASMRSARLGRRTAWRARLLRRRGGTGRGRLTPPPARAGGPAAGGGSSSRMRSSALSPWRTSLLAEGAQLADRSARVGHRSVRTLRATSSHGRMAEPRGKGPC